MLPVKTHTKIDRSLNGEVVEIRQDSATVKLRTTDVMSADDKGLVHGGFIFSAADYAAMLSVNHPNVVLAGAEVKFIRPVKVGDEVIFKGKVEEKKGRKVEVYVEGRRNGEKVFEGTFHCVVLDRHVLEKE